MADFPKLTLVTGGASSGKSRFAERLVNRSGRKKLYVATAQAFDVEMQTKIARHRADRDELWRTVEAPLDLGPVLEAVWSDEVVLIDCMTMWLNNHMLAEHDVTEASDALVASLDGLKSPAVLVTNEVGSGVVPANELARRFAQEQGRLNQRIARRANLVVAVMSGLPLALKGVIPEGLA
jgi:adenosylcobinamide kinase/adenosylcobinamide-phosphate guanylyltransferase